MRKTRVLLLLHNLSLTGAPNVAAHAFEALHPHLDLKIIALDGGPLLAHFQALGPVQILADPPPAGLSSGPLLRRAAQAVPRGAILRLNGRLAPLRLGLRRWEPDVIYVNGILALHCARYVRLPPVPALLHVHETGSALDIYTQPVSHLFLDWPQRYIAVSEATRQSLMERFQMPSEKIAVIHSFVANQEFPRLAASSDPATSTPLVIGGAGRISWCKGPALWLLMAAELKKMLGEDRVRFVWVGVADEEDDRRFREMAHKLHLEHLIEFVPVTSQPLQHFAHFDVFAMTSWEDSCPLVVLENMMLQKPVVCFAGGGGAPEEVGETGIIIEEFSPAAMAQAIAQLAASPERRAELGTAARERVLQHFTTSVQAPKILREIESLAKA